MFMVSSGIGSWPRGVILTVRSAVFICGETDVMVPWMMVPGACVRELEIIEDWVASKRRGEERTGEEQGMDRV